MEGYFDGMAGCVELQIAVRPFGTVVTSDFGWDLC